MHKIAVIGDRDSVLGFKALGLDTFPADNVQRAKELLHSLAREAYAIIFITEEMAELMMKDIDLYNDKMAPAVIPVPSKAGGNGLGMKRVKDSVERAVGADILG